MILAIDSSTATACVALADNDKIVYNSLLNAGLTHSQTLMPMIEQAINLSGKKPLEKIIVTVGPGSFTGVRIAVSIAKGLALAENIDCVEVSSLEALAYNLVAFSGEYMICPMLDARLKRAYTALFELKNNEITRLTDDNCLDFESISKVLECSDKDILLLGDGVEPFLKEYEKYAPMAVAQELRYIDGISVLLAGKGKNTTGLDDLRPEYLQLPQAERERLQRLEKQVFN